MPPPVSDEASRHDPEEPVVPAHAGAPTGPQRDSEMLPQQQVFHDEGLPAPECDEPSAGEKQHSVQRAQ
jgi:hypothetical protein